MMPATRGRAGAALCSVLVLAMIGCATAQEEYCRTEATGSLGLFNSTHSVWNFTFTVPRYPGADRYGFVSCANEFETHMTYNDFWANHNNCPNGIGESISSNRPLSVGEVANVSIYANASMVGTEVILRILCPIECDRTLEIPMTHTMDINGTAHAYSNYTFLSATNGYVTFSTCSNPYDTAIDSGNYRRNTSMCGVGRHGELLAQQLHLVDADYTYGNLRVLSNARSIGETVELKVECPREVACNTPITFQHDASLHMVVPANAGIDTGVEYNLSTCASSIDTVLHLSDPQYRTGRWINNIGCPTNELLRRPYYREGDDVWVWVSANVQNLSITTDMLLNSNLTFEFQCTEGLTYSPTLPPTVTSPTLPPTMWPTASQPTISPTSFPTSSTPSQPPSQSPSPSPSQPPSQSPSQSPSESPSHAPSAAPTSMPSEMVFATRRGGQIVWPTDNSGAVALPTDMMGVTVLPTDRMGVYLTPPGFGEEPASGARSDDKSEDSSSLLIAIVVVALILIVVAIIAGVFVVKKMHAVTNGPTLSHRGTVAFDNPLYDDVQDNSVAGRSSTAKASSGYMDVPAAAGGGSSGYMDVSSDGTDDGTYAEVAEPAGHSGYMDVAPNTGFDSDEDV